MRKAAILLKMITFTLCALVLIHPARAIALPLVLRLLEEIWLGFPFIYKEQRLLHLRRHGQEP